MPRWTRQADARLIRLTVDTRAEWPHSLAIALTAFGGKVMEIHLDAAETRTLREAARYAASNTDTIALEVDLYIVFSVEERRRIEERLDDANLFRYLRDLVAGWDRRDPDDLLALVVTCLGGLDVRLSLTHQVEVVMEEARKNHSEHLGRVASAAS